MRSLVRLAIDYEIIKKLILIFLVLMVINYSFNSIFNYDYLLPLNLAILVGLYIPLQFLFPQKFELLKEDVIMAIIILYCLFHSLFSDTLDYTLLVIGMSFVPYFLSRFIILEDKDVDFIFKVFCIFGVVLLGVYYKHTGFSAGSGRFRMGGRHPVGIAADFGLVAVSFSYFLFTTKKHWIKLICLCLLIATFYMTVFILGTRGASFSGIIAITYLYFMLSADTIGDKFKRLLLVAILITGFFILVNNENFITKYPTLRRFSIEGMSKDPSLKGSENGGDIGRKGFALRSIEIISRSFYFGEGLGIVYSHNIFLEWMASLGLVGLLPFLFFLFTIFTKAFKFRKINPRFTIFFTMLIYTFVLRLISFSMISHKSFFVVCGLLLSYYYSSEKS